MGVPAFFRWLSRKFPSVIVECVENKVKTDITFECKHNHIVYAFQRCFFAIGKQ